MKKFPLVGIAMALASLTAHPLAAQSGEMKDMSTFERPIAMADNVWIEELTMPEVRDLLAEGWRTALILTGGIEENGPYLTTGKHNHVLKVMGESIARQFGKTLVAPIVTIEPGNPERASSPGGIRYSQETYRAVLRDYAVSLRAQGFENIFLMGDSGGTLRGMTEVAEELGIDEDPRPEGLHDDYYITTIIMNDDPEHVRLGQRIDAGKASINGISILPIDTALEHGRRLIQFRTDATIEAMRAAIAAQRQD